MDIIFQGNYDNSEAAENLAGVLRLFQERYQISKFREMHLTVTLVDDHGNDVELIDNETGNIYRFFEVYRHDHELKTNKRTYPLLQLVVDNTR